MENTFGVPSVTRSINQPYQPYSFHKGTMSKTHPGDMDFTTKKGNKVFHQNQHFVRKSYKPYSFHKGSKSKTRKGRKNFTTKKGSKVFHRKGKYVRKSYKPYSRRRKH